MTDVVAQLRAQTEIAETRRREAQTSSAYSLAVTLGISRTIYADEIESLKDLDLRGAFVDRIYQAAIQAENPLESKDVVSHFQIAAHAYFERFKFSVFSKSKTAYRTALIKAVRNPAPFLLAGSFLTATALPGPARIYAFIGSVVAASLYGSYKYLSRDKANPDTDLALDDRVGKDLCSKNKRILENDFKKIIDETLLRLLDPAEKRSVLQSGLMKNASEGVDFDTGLVKLLKDASYASAGSKEFVGPSVEKEIYAAHAKNAGKHCVRPGFREIWRMSSPKWAALTAAP
ncbi:MAG TPA: hypothetical protein VMV79_00485 [Alphaproteobacteria bacterium]|nr:hypothetical protein [Alphaproteobacteria bacterium]